MASGGFFLGSFTLLSTCMYMNYGLWFTVCVLYQNVADMYQLSAVFKGKTGTPIRQ